MTLARRLFTVAIFGMASCVLVWPTGAGAATKIRIETKGCSRLIPSEIERLLKIERIYILSLIPRSQLPKIAISCRGDSTRISIDDPVTGRRAARSIPSPPPTSIGRERELAIATSQLILVTWLELLLTDDAKGIPEATKTQIVRRLAHEQEARPRARPTPWTLGVSASSRVSVGSNPFVLWGGRLRVQRHLTSGFEAFVHVSAETGRDGREQGDASALLLEGGGGVLRTFWLSDRIGLPISAMLAVGYVRLKGEASSTAFAGATESGVIGEARATFGVLWRLDRYRLGLDLEGGGLFPTTTGKVEGAEAVELSGLWLGAKLSAQIEL